MALAAEHPVELGERCTVLMESKDFYPEIAAGAGKEDLCAGLSRSIVELFKPRGGEQKGRQVICFAGRHHS